MDSQSRHDAVTFTSPAIASVGLTDAQAVTAGYHCDCRTLPLEYAPRAIVNRDTRGIVKVIADADTGRVLGVHAVAKFAVAPRRPSRQARCAPPRARRVRSPVRRHLSSGGGRHPAGFDAPGGTK